MTKKAKEITIISVISGIVVIALVAIICMISMQPMMMGVFPITFVEATTSMSDIDGKDGYKLFTTKAGDIIACETSFIRMPISHL